MKKFLYFALSVFFLAASVLCIAGIMLCWRTIALVDQTLQSLESLQGKASNVNSLVEFGGEAAGSLVIGKTPQQEDEIDDLIKKLRKSSISWISAEGEKPLVMLCALVESKYALLKGSISSKEDFINRVCNADMLGKEFRVKTTAGTEMSLQDWMRKE